jgi:hypothetical protein
MGINYWLVYIYAQNNIDYKYAMEAIYKSQKGLDSKSGLLVLLFGPTLRSKVVLTRVLAKESTILEYLPSNEHSQVENTRYMIGRIKKLGYSPKNLCFWGHGSGWVIGPWKTAKVPFMTITDFVNLVIIPLKIEFICYDACYMGSISSLYEHPEHVKVIVAAPAFHPYSSLMWVKSFSRIPNLNTKMEMLKYASKLSCEWHIITKQKFKCIMVFDTEKVKKIANEIKKHGKELLFDKKKSQIDKEESNLHDLSVVARNVSSIIKLNKEITRATCKKCVNSCTERVNGISIERHLPRKWQESFKATRWYKEIFSKVHSHSL